MSAEIAELPVFPLNTVLFPGMALPLHIFEDRYVLMVNECLEGNRHFGVLLAQPAPDEEGATEVHRIGTLALITHVDRLDDGRMDIRTTGLERFRVLRMLRSEPYIVAQIEEFPLEDTQSSRVAGLARQANGLLVRYLRLLGEVLGTAIRIDSVPRDPSSLAHLIAIALQVELDEKQELLSIPDLPGLLRRETLILSREEVLLSQLREVQKSDACYLRGVTGYLSLS